MKTRSRLILSALIACTVVGGLSIVLLKLGRKSPSAATSPPEPTVETTVPSQRVAPAAAAKPEAPSNVESEKVAPSTIVSSVPRDKFIEEDFAQAGEDLDAVYYMSRVREAMRYGNRTFARQLFNQMKELHPDSPLIGESEALLSAKVKGQDRVR